MSMLAKVLKCVSKIRAATGLRNKSLCFRGPSPWVCQACHVHATVLFQHYESCSQNQSQPQRNMVHRQQRLQTGESVLAKMLVCGNAVALSDQKGHSERL